MNNLVTEPLEVFIAIKKLKTKNTIVFQNERDSSETFMEAVSFQVFDSIKIGTRYAVNVTEKRGGFLWLQKKKVYEILDTCDSLLKVVEDKSIDKEKITKFQEEWRDK